MNQPQKLLLQLSHINYLVIWRYRDARSCYQLQRWSEKTPLDNMWETTTTTYAVKIPFTMTCKSLFIILLFMPAHLVISSSGGWLIYGLFRTCIHGLIWIGDIIDWRWREISWGNLERLKNVFVVTPCVGKIQEFDFSTLKITYRSWLSERLPLGRLDSITIDGSDFVHVCINTSITVIQFWHFYNFADMLLLLLSNQLSLYTYWSSFTMP